MARLSSNEYIFFHYDTAGFMALLLDSNDNSLRAGALSVDVEPSSFRDYVSVNKQYNVCDYHVYVVIVALE